MTARGARPWAEHASGGAGAGGESLAVEWAGLGLRLRPAAAQQVRIPEGPLAGGQGGRTCPGRSQPSHSAGGAAGLTVGSPACLVFCLCLRLGSEVAALSGDLGVTLSLLSGAWGGGQMPPGVLAASDRHPHKPLTPVDSRSLEAYPAPHGGVNRVAPHGPRQHPEVLTHRCLHPRGQVTLRVERGPGLGQGRGGAGGAGSGLTASLMILVLSARVLGATHGPVLYPHRPIEPLKALWSEWETEAQRGSAASSRSCSLDTVHPRLVFFLKQFNVFLCLHTYMHICASTHEQTC